MKRKRSLGVIILSIYLFAFGLISGGRVFSDSLLRFDVINLNDFIIKMQFLGSIFVTCSAIFIIQLKESARRFTITICIFMLMLTLSLWAVNYQSQYISLLIMLGIPSMTLVIPIFYLNRPQVKEQFK